MSVRGASGSRLLTGRCLRLVPSVVALLGCDGGSDVGSPRAPVKDRSAAPLLSAQGALGEPAQAEPLAPPVRPLLASPSACPSGMSAIPGGTFWVGRATPTFENEENPRFRTTLPAFCAHTHEVTARAYEACVAKGTCTAIVLDNLTCNSVAKGRGDHPANCVDHGQASTFCRAEGARLPTEIEWEYLARGGTEMRPYPWGEASPDDHACWKANRSCKVGSYPAGAFGLFDVVGNVWEWTDSWFGAYPWPNVDGRHRVYRGGSWSRRFDKWMQPTLRNRAPPKDAGSHLGFRCVQSQPEAECPYGPGETGCKFGIDQVQCLGQKVWNGVRCAAPSDTARCPGSSREIPGRGCQWEDAVPVVGGQVDLTLVRQIQSPQFDADCRQNQPNRPRAYRLEGGEHLARNQVAQDRGCKNRDVGVGWNSICCPSSPGSGP